MSSIRYSYALVRAHKSFFFQARQIQMSQILLCTTEAISLLITLAAPC